MFSTFSQTDSNASDATMFQSWNDLEGTDGSFFKSFNERKSDNESDWDIFEQTTQEMEEVPAAGVSDKVRVPSTSADGTKMEEPSPSSCVTGGSKRTGLLSRKRNKEAKEQRAVRKDNTKSSQVLLTHTFHISVRIIHSCRSIYRTTPQLSLDRKEMLTLT